MRRVWKRTGPWAKVTTAVVVLALAGLGVWWFGFRGDGAAAATPITRTVQASTTTMEKTVSATGTVSPTVEDDVSFAVSGTVTGVSVTQGQTVTAGQVLGTLDTLPLQAADLQAKSNLASAQATLSNAQAAADGSAASNAKIAAAQSQVQVAQASVTTADANLAATTLTAPVSGLLTSVNVQVGNAVTGAATTSASSSSQSTASPSQNSFGGGGGGNNSNSNSSSSSSSSAPFVIVGTDAWQVDVTVSDTDIANVKAGDQAEVTIQNATGTIYGTVGAIGLLSTSSSGVAGYPVTIDVTPGQSGLHDGESATARIIYSKRTNVLAVPSFAVRTDASGNSVVTKVDAEGKQTQVTVKTGETSGQMTEITSGLAAGDSVVLQVFTPGSTGNRNRTGQNGQRGEGGFGQFPGGGQFFQGGGGGQGGGGQGGGNFGNRTGNGQGGGRG
jgi:multidrug efflux pump subunit AcrA (membrane-fusion protein)